MLYHVIKFIKFISKSLFSKNLFVKLTVKGFSVLILIAIKELVYKVLKLIWAIDVNGEIFIKVKWDVNKAFVKKKTFSY